MMKELEALKRIDEKNYLTEKERENTYIGVKKRG